MPLTEQDVTVELAEVTYQEGGNFDNYYIHAFAYFNESAIKFQDFTLTSGEGVSGPHTVVMNCTTDTSETNILEIETPVTGTVSLGTFGLAQGATFTINFEIKKDGVSQFSKSIARTNSNAYERPMP